MYATQTIMTELLRLALPAPGGGEQLQINLFPVANGVNRSRASTRYAVEVGMPWVLPDVVALCDARGYDVAWTLAEVAQWMARALPGTSHAVSINISEAASLPARWTDARLQAQVDKLAALDPVAIRAQAEAKRATVSTWVESDRKNAILNAASAMEQVADRIEFIRAADPWGQ